MTKKYPTERSAAILHFSCRPKDRPVASHAPKRPVQPTALARARGIDEDIERLIERCVLGVNQVEISAGLRVIQGRVQLLIQMMGEQLNDKR